MNLHLLQKRVVSGKPILPTPLLDEFPNAAAAYSLRLLSSSYTGNCIQVRRSSDNALQNIGFVDGVLDTASLLSFVGAGDGFVRTWYDQSLNNNNAVQSDITRQPQIVLNGNLLLTGTKPSLNFDGVNDFLATNNQTFNTGLHSFFTVLQNFQQRNESFFGNRNLTNDGFINAYRISPSRFFAANPGSGTLVRNDLLPQYHINTVVSSSNNNYINLDINNNLATSFVSSNNYIASAATFKFAQDGRGQDFAQINMQEFVGYLTNMQSDIAGIKSNMNNYYGVF